MVLACHITFSNEISTVVPSAEFLFATWTCTITSLLRHDVREAAPPESHQASFAVQTSHCIHVHPSESAGCLSDVVSHACTADLGTGVHREAIIRRLCHRCVLCRIGGASWRQTPPQLVRGRDVPAVSLCFEYLRLQTGSCRAEGDPAPSWTPVEKSAVSLSQPRLAGTAA